MMDSSASVTRFTSQPNKVPEPDQECALLEYKKEGEHYKMPEQVVLKFRSQPFISSRKGKITIASIILLTLAIAGTVTFLFTFRTVTRDIRQISEDQYEVKLNHSSILRKYYWASLRDFVPSVNKSSHWNLVDMARGNVTLVQADQQIPFGGTTKWSNHLLYINANKTNVNRIMLTMGDLLRSESMRGTNLRDWSVASDLFSPDDDEDPNKQKNATLPRNKPLPIKAMSLQE